MMNDAIEVLGWTLLHFVWQGAAVGALTAMMLLALRRRSANARYLTAVVALGLMLLLPLGTIAWIEQTPPVGEVSPIFNTISMIEIPRTREDGTLALDEPLIKAERIGIDFENPPPADAVPLIPVSDTGQTILEDLAEQRSAFGVESSLKPFIPWAVAAWLIGVGVLSLRLLASWLSVQRLRRQATQPADENWQAMLRSLAERLRVTRPVQLVESALVEVPTVIGWLKPIILLPASAMTGLTTEQLEALLAHELAHVRRHDYLVNLLQTVVETLLFYHPAVWWLSHRIRVEREHCCDDLAASVCGDRLSYAKALVAMEELRAPPLGLAMSARGGSLLSRVTRLLRPTESQRQPVGWLAGLIVMLTLTLAGALGAGLLTPPNKPTEGLPNATQPTTKTTDTNEATSDPDQQQGVTRNADVTKSNPEIAQQQPASDKKLSKQDEERNREIRLRRELGKLARMDFDRQPLDKVVLYLQDYHNTPIKLDRESLSSVKISPQTPITVRFEDRLTSGLERLLGPLGLVAIVDRGELRVMSEADAQKAGHRISHSVRGGIEKLTRNSPDWPWEKLCLGRLNAEERTALAARESELRRVLQKLLKDSETAAVDLAMIAQAAWLLDQLDSDLGPTSREVRARATGEKGIPIHGRCLDNEGKALSEADVRLYRQRNSPFEYLLLKSTKADSEGRFDLGEWPELPDQEHYTVGARAKGFASAKRAAPSNSQSLARPAPLTFRLFPGATLQGTVAGPDQRPLKGVRLQRVYWTEGLQSATTDEQGRFVIDDLDEVLAESGRRSRLVLLHPEFGRKDIWYSKCPDRVDVKFVTPATVEGALLAPNGSPARNELLHCQLLNEAQPDYPPIIEMDAMTDDQGRFRFALQEEGKLNIYHIARNPNFVAAAIDSFEIALGETRSMSPMKLVTGGLIRGQVIDVGTGKPVICDAHERFHIGTRGPSRPASGPGVAIAYVQPDGSYALRVAPGENYPYISRSSSGPGEWFIGEGAYNAKQALNQPVEVAEGQTVILNFTVSRKSIRNVPGDPMPLPIGQSTSKPFDSDPTKLRRFVGRVWLKTEKSLPDLEKVELPAGKVLDESLVFSKDGGLANVFVYLRRPTFSFDEQAVEGKPKPFILIADKGKFWPHAALVRVGRPLMLDNVQAEPENIRSQPFKNAPWNYLVRQQDRAKAPAFTLAETLPTQIKSDTHSWMLAHLLPLDHPFAAVTDEDGRFTINGLPPGEHEFRVWHERVGYLEKSLKITIKAGEDARSELEYTSDRLKLTEAEVLGWGNRQIDAKWVPRAMVPRPAVKQPKQDEEKKPDSAGRESGAGRGSPDPAQKPTEGLPERASDSPRGENAKSKDGDLRSNEAAGSGDPRRAQEVVQKAAVARAEYEKILDANRRVPGSSPDTEVERLRLAYEKALLAVGRLAVERAIDFLKSQQQENGTWQGTPLDGVSALCAAALLQAGVKADDPVMQKALAHLRTIKPTLSYTVALQTMVFCSASPKEDAELIRRNVAWLEKAQATEGPNRGGWSYMENNTKIADGSCSRFVMLGLHAAKKAGIEVKAETWRNASDYWMSSQKKENHAWGYQPGSGVTPSMTLSGMACLAIVNQHLPQDEQTKLRAEAIERAVPFVEPNAHLLWQSGHGGYALQCLERAAHLNRWQKFGKHELRKLLDEKLLGLQRPEGHWTGVGGSGGGFFAAPAEQTLEQKAAAEAARRRQVQSDDLIATSFALMCLTGQPEPPRERQLRFEPREMGKKFQMRSNLVENSSPPMQRTEISGGVRIEAVEPDGSMWRIEADRAVIESRARVNEEIEFASSSDVTHIVCIGSVKIEAGRGDQLTQATGEKLELDLRRNGGVLSPPRILP